MHLQQKVKKTIEFSRLFKRGDSVLIGVSGGPDSVCLLSILHSLRYDFGLSLYIGHFNHGLRKSARNDQLFVKNLAEKWSIPFITATKKVATLHKRGGLEQYAREARFRFFKNTVKKYHINVVALGHNENDVAETVLMRMLRGTGLSGLRGILAKRDIDGITFVRPLIECSRSEIECFLKKEKLSFCTDPTNKDRKLYRNKIRTELLPLLEKEYNSNIHHLLANLSKIISTDYNFLEEFTHTLSVKIITKIQKQKYRINMTKLSQLHPSIQRMMVRQAIEKIKGSTRKMDLLHIEKILGLINHPLEKAIDLPKGLCVKKKTPYLIFSMKKV